jgi:hypothetical protein
MAASMTPESANDPSRFPNLETQVGQKLWPTPDCSDRRSDKSKQQGLSNEVKNWATPQASDFVEGRRTDVDSNQKCLGRDLKMMANWGTPLAQDSRHGNEDRGKGKLGEQIAGRAIVYGAAKLNPDWVCSLMGLPIKWVRL